MPKDYTSGTDEKTKVVVSKMSATGDDPIGTLVVNYGLSGTGMFDDLSEAEYVFSEELREKFDLIAIDQRGISHDAQMRCFKKSADQQRIMTALDAEPNTQGNRLEYLQATKDFAAECRKSLPAELLAVNSELHARDLNTVREAMGLSEINILATEGQDHTARIYAELFGDSVRALVADGIQPSHTIQGNAVSSHQNLAERTGRIEATENSLTAIFEACDRKAATHCALTGGKDGKPTAQERFNAVMAELKKGTIDYNVTLRFLDENGDVAKEESFSSSISYDDMYQMALGAIDYAGYEAQSMTSQVALLERVLAGEKDIVVDVPGMLSEEEKMAFAKRMRDPRDRTVPGVGGQQAIATQSGSQAPHRPNGGYDKVAEYGRITACNNSKVSNNLHGARTRIHRAAAGSEMFGEKLAWGQLYCHGWNDSMASTDLSFNAKTKNPMLIVAKRHSSVTPYHMSQAAAARHSNAVLLTDNDWGTASYSQNDCVTAAVDEYLLTLKTPENTTCEPSLPLFDEELEEGYIPLSSAKSAKLHNIRQRQHPGKISTLLPKN